MNFYDGRSDRLEDFFGSDEREMNFVAFEMVEVRFEGEEFAVRQNSIN